MSRLADFEKHDADNPAIYEQFKRFAFEAIGAGYKYLSTNLIINRIRWETAIYTKDSSFKLNDHWAPFYARKFIDEFPHHSGFFRTRKMRQC